MTIKNAQFKNLQQLQHAVATNEPIDEGMVVINFSPRKGHLVVIHKTANMFLVTNSLSVAVSDGLVMMGMNNNREEYASLAEAMTSFIGMYESKETEFTDMHLGLYEALWKQGIDYNEMKYATTNTLNFSIGEVGNVISVEVNADDISYFYKGKEISSTYFSKSGQEVITQPDLLERFCVVVSFVQTFLNGDFDPHNENGLDTAVERSILVANTIEAIEENYERYDNWGYVLLGEIVVGVFNDGTPLTYQAHCVDGAVVLSYSDKRSEDVMFEFLDDAVDAFIEELEGWVAGDEYIEIEEDEEE